MAKRTVKKHGKREIWELVERETGKIKRSGDYYTMALDCIERGTYAYVIRLKGTW